MAFYLGIDGGGTKTKFLLGDDHQVLAEATTAGSNILRSGDEPVRRALHAGVEEVCTAAKIEPTAIQHTVGGIAGSSNDDVRTRLETFLREQLTGAITVVGDMVIAHHAALSGASGVLINAGTGSIAYGRNATGDTARAGGWGFAISDEGSGHWIGRLAVATAMRCYDTGKEQAYLHHLIAALNVKEPAELAAFANSTTNPDFAHLFPTIVFLADEGDETARKILKHAGEELASLAEAVLDRLFKADDPTIIAASGGVFRNSTVVFDAFRDAIHATHSQAAAILSDSDPASGALMLAREHT